MAKTRPQFVREGGCSTHYIYSFDGKDYAFANYEKSSPDKQELFVYGGGSFGREGRISWTERPWPFCYYYVGKIPLHQALEDSVHVGADVINGIKCESFTFKNLRTLGSPGNLRVALDAETGVPISFYWEDLTQRPQWKWEATRIASADGYHFPVESTYQDLSHGEEIVKFSFETTTLEFNRPVAKSVFQIAPQAGVKVIGSPEGKPNAQSSQKKESAATTTVTPPPEGTPAAYRTGWNWGLVGAQMAFAVAGAAMLAVYARKRFFTR